MRGLVFAFTFRRWGGRARDEERSSTLVLPLDAKRFHEWQAARRAEQ